MSEGAENVGLEEVVADANMQADDSSDFLKAISAAGNNQRTTPPASNPDPVVEELKPNPAKEAAKAEPDVDPWLTYAPEPLKAFKPDEVVSKITEFEQLQTRIKEIESDPFFKLDEKEREFLGVYRSGMDPMDYKALHSTDFVAMDAKEVLRYQFKKDNPKAPTHLLEPLFEQAFSQKYPNISIDDPEDTQFQMDQWKMQEEAAKHREALIAYQAQNRYQLPAKATPDTSEQKSVVDQAELDKQAEHWLKHTANVEEVLNTTPALSFEWKDKEHSKNVNVPLASDQGEKALLADFMKDPGKTLTQYFQKEMVDEKGNVNYAKLLKLGALLQNPEKIIRSAYESGANHREIEIRKEKKNLQQDGSLHSVDSEPGIEAFLGVLSASAKGK